MTHTTAEEKMSKDAELYMKTFTDVQSLILYLKELQRMRALYSAASVGHFLCKNVHWLHSNSLTLKQETTKMLLK